MKMLPTVKGTGRRERETSAPTVCLCGHCCCRTFTSGSREKGRTRESRQGRQRLLQQQISCNACGWIPSLSLPLSIHSLVFSLILTLISTRSQREPRHYSLSGCCSVSISISSSKGAKEANKQSYPPLLSLSSLFSLSLRSLTATRFPVAVHPSSSLWRWTCASAPFPLPLSLPCLTPSRLQLKSFFIS